MSLIIVSPILAYTVIAKPVQMFMRVIANTTVHFFTWDQFFGFSESFSENSTRYLFSSSIGIVAVESFFSLDSAFVTAAVSDCWWSGRCTVCSCTIDNNFAGLVQVKKLD